jgi:hypothetical protein
LPTVYEAEYQKAIAVKAAEIEVQNTKVSDKNVVSKMNWL